MVAEQKIMGYKPAKTVNIVCLFVAIALIFLLPLDKQVWYDETVSIRCSKGISHDTPMAFSGVDTTTSADFAKLNTAGNVFNATVLDNGNSFFYNLCLHYFSLLFGNSLYVYMLFSKLIAIAALLAFYVLCNYFLKDNIFTSVAVLLLATDNDFNGMSHEIRAYAMGIFFVTIAAIYFFRFLDKGEKPRDLFFAGLFSTGAILSHFLSVYIVLVFLGVLLLSIKGRLFSKKNILVIIPSVLLLAVFFYCSYTGLQMMGNQNQQILERSASQGFSIVEVLNRSIKFTAINFKAVFPAFGNKPLATISSFLLIILLYVASIRAAADNSEKRNLHVLFWLGAFGSVFLLLLSIKSHHYTALYYRYYSFCVPFCCLFIAYMLFVLFKNQRINWMLKDGLAAILILPVALLFILGILSAKPFIAYNHIIIAKKIAQGNVHILEVPEWEDALLVQCFLPGGYNLDYVRNRDDSDFVLHGGNAIERIPVIKHN